MQSLYLPADRGKQGEWLSQREAVTGLHRKSLIRLLHAPTLERKRRSKQRGRTYEQTNPRQLREQIYCAIVKLGEKTATAVA